VFLDKTMLFLVGNRRAFAVAFIYATGVT